MVIFSHRDIESDSIIHFNTFVFLAVFDPSELYNTGIKVQSIKTYIASTMLKEHCTQKKIWIHLMQNIFRNQTVKN